MKSTALLCTLALVAGGAFAQADEQDHAAHHPDGAASAPASSAPSPDAGTGPQFTEQMARMQDMHRRMQAARTPAERRALMDEHLKLMQSGMDMMSRMGGAGPRGGPPASSDRGPGAPEPMGPMAGAGPMAGTGGMGQMMAMHDRMERRMAMMEQMMQMMVDRAAASERQR